MYCSATGCGDECGDTAKHLRNGIFDGWLTRGADLYPLRSALTHSPPHTRTTLPPCYLLSRHPLYQDFCVCSIVDLLPAHLDSNAPDVHRFMDILDDISQRWL